MHLGKNWSGIDTGLLAAFVGSAVAVGQWRGVLAVSVVVLALIRKLELAERWMRGVFGRAYEEYRRRVPALIPMMC